MNQPVRTKTPAGEDIVMMPVADYERLLELAEDARDSRIAEKALAEIAAGKVELLTHAEVDALLKAPSPIAFWRKRRALTQTVLAEIAGITQPYLAQIEGGKRTGDVKLYRRLAAALDVDVEDLLPVDLERPRPARKTRRRKA